MNPAVIGIFIPIVAIAGTFGMLISIRHYQNVERMAMIEKGLTPNDPEWTKELKRSGRNNPFRVLRLALLGIGIGLGFLFGNVIAAFMPASADEYKDGIVIGLILIFGGCGLLGAYLMEMGQKKANPNAEDII